MSVSANFVEDFAAYPGYLMPAAIYRRAPAELRQRLPSFGGIGTGGLEWAGFISSRQGYSPYTITPPEAATLPAPNVTFAALMSNVRAGFGRTMSHLPAVFGVSRQTLYNWLEGELPREQHQNKIVQLAAAADVFVEIGFKPTSTSLDRTVEHGKSFVELIGEGADGRVTAQRLVRIVTRGAASRVKLDELLSARTSERLSASDMGRPALNETI